jgi:nucleoside 2-deoxyribosyltransferase
MNVPNLRGGRKAVYISSHSIEQAAALATELRMRQFEVVSKWHDMAGDRIPMEDRETWKQNAIDNFDLIDNCHSLVLMGGDERYPGGKFVELGYAAKAGKSVICLGRIENGMVSGLAKTVGDIEQLVNVLRTEV